MIVAEQKPIADIVKFIGDARSVLIIGCGECVTVCHSGGEKNVQLLSSQLAMHFKSIMRPVDVAWIVSRRQCDPEFNENLISTEKQPDVIISLGCGAGAQTLAVQFPSLRVFPGLNTRFMGAHTSLLRWEERCAGCGNCTIHLFGGFCPISRCSKSLLNGPCGGSFEGRCEVDPLIDCIWQKIIDRLTDEGQLESLEEIRPPKDWRTSSAGGPRSQSSEE